MSTQPNDGGFAFPFTPTDRSGQIGPTEPGMSLRAYFAGQALVAIPHIGCGADLNTQELVLAAIQTADALIAELNKTQQ